MLPSTSYPTFAPPDLDGSPGAFSDHSLTQESFDAILWNGLGAQIGANPDGMDGMDIDFWRVLDASFEPATEGGEVTAGSPFAHWAGQ